MAVVDDLFQLIRALTPSEKRYFKIHAKTHVAGKYKNNYEKLFDAMNYWPEEEEYDEKLFKRKHKGKSFLKNLSSEKNYLYELIMETMRSFHNEKTIDRQINDLLLDEDFFRKKRLNNQRQKAIEKGKELAKKYEKLPALLTLIERENILQKELKQSELKNWAIKPITEEQSILGQLHQLAKLRYFSNRLFINVRINNSQNNVDIKSESQTILEDLVVSQYVVGSSFWCDYHYYRIYAMHSLMHKNNVMYEYYSKLIFELYELHYAHQRQNNLSGYKIALYNFLNASFSAGNLKLFPELLNKARALPSTSKDEEGEDWQNLIHIELFYLINTGDLEKAKALAPNIEIGIQQYKQKVNKARELTLYYNLAAAFFITADWERALFYYNKVLSDNSDARKDLKNAAELLFLAAQFELKNFDLIEYLQRNIERRFKGTSFYAISNEFNKFTKKLIKTSRLTLKEEDAAQLQNQFSTYFEIGYWIRSKIEGKEMEKLFLEKVLASG